MRSAWWPRLGLVIWSVVVAMTAWAAFARPEAQAPTGLVYEPYLSYALQPGRRAVFVVPADVERVRLISRTAVPEGALGLAGDPIDYPVIVRWRDEDVVLEHTFWESSGVSRMPGPGLSVWQNAWLTDASDAVTDDRVTLVPIQTVLPRGGALEVESPADGGTLYVRLYGEEIRGAVDAGLKLFGPSSQLREGLLHRVGLPAWSLLDRGERRALTRTVWKSLGPDAATREALEPSWMYRSDVRLSLPEQRLAFQTLGAGRSVAINLVGPTEISLSGHSDIADLRVHWVGLTGEVPVERPVRPVDFAGAIRGRGFGVPPGPGSLVFENPTSAPVGPFWWTLDDVGPDTLFGLTEATRITTMAPPGTWTGDDVVLVGPELNLLDAWRVGEEQELAWSGAWPAQGDVLQLLVRAVLAGPDDVRTRTYRVTGWDALGRQVWSDAAGFAPAPAPFEHLFGTDLWLAEPIVTWVPVDSRIRKLTVTSRDGLVVMLRGEGAPQGDPDFYPVRDERLAIRYPRRPVTTWRSIDPDGPVPESQRARIVANVRLEPAGDGRVAVARRYTSLEPVAAPAPPVTWLLPTDADPNARSLYCRYTAGTTGPFARDSAAVSALDGVISGVLWTSGPASLGEPYRIDTDGVTWQEGRLSQRVYAFRTGREPARSRVTFEAPPGSVLWMRTVAAPQDGCPDAHEARRYWTLEPGERVVFEVTRTLDRQVFGLSALGAPRSELWVQVDDGQQLSSGLHPTWTQKQRILDLFALETPGRAHPLEDPDASAEILAPRGVSLGSNLAGNQFRITVENASSTRVHVRGLLETRGEAPRALGLEEVGLMPIAEEVE